MALVLLPCDLPTWPTLQRHLTHLRNAQTTTQLLEGMMAIYHLCNISLDPDDDKPDLTVFDGLTRFMDEQCTPLEQRQFFETILPTMAEFALRLRTYKPHQGLHYSLQQHSDHVILQRGLVASLIAHVFFCTFPRRTLKTHPTLQDFTCTHFFQPLTNSVEQQDKVRSVFRYFQWLHQHSDSEVHLSESLTVCRQVMSSKEWLTLRDWTGSRRPLCPVLIRHEGRIQDAEEGTCQVCFVSPHIGGHVLQHGLTQECLQLTRNPELLACTLPFVEALQDNEALTIHGHQTFHSSIDSQNLEGNNQSSCICIDAEDYSDCPIRQFEEDEILRELNKAFTGFRQNGALLKDKVSTPTVSTPCSQNVTRSTTLCESNSTDSQTLPAEKKRHGRTPLVVGTLHKTLDQSTMTSDRESPLESPSTTLLYGGGRTEPLSLNHCVQKPVDLETNNNTIPKSRNVAASHRQDSSDYTSCHSSSTNTSFDSAESHPHKAPSTSDSDERLRRSCSSRGFTLEDEYHEDDGFSGDGLEREREWLRYFRDRRSRSRSASQRERDSSRYSFSSEFSSELDEMYDQFSHWLEDPEGKELRPRDLALFRFAHSLLKRTLSDSFATVALGIEHLPSGIIKSSDIKLGTSAQHSTHASKLNLRSQSLSEAVYHHERLALHVAKEILAKDASQLRRPDFLAEQPGNLPCLPVSTSACTSTEPVRLTAIPTVQFNCLDPNDDDATTDAPHFVPAMRTQASVAWEYHQDPFCEFQVTLPSKPNTILAPLANQNTEWVVEATVWVKRALNAGKLTRAESVKALAFLRSRTWTREESNAHLQNLRSLSVIVDSNNDYEPSTQKTHSHVLPLERGRSTVSQLISSPASNFLPTNPTPAQSQSKLSVIHQKPTNVVLLDRMTSLSSSDDPTHPTKKADSNSSQESSVEPITMIPSKPTPPRTRRGSWLLKTTKQRHSKSKAIQNTPPQRARSNSVPAVMEFAQLALPLLNPDLPDIVISPSVDSGANTEAFPFFPYRRHHSIDTLNLQASVESLLSNEVVEGFSYTMAEKIVEDIVREWPTTTSLHGSTQNLQSPGTYGTQNPFFPTKLTRSIARKGILKNKSTDSLYRSHSGSLDLSVGETEERSASPRPKPDSKVSAAQRSTSMPSLQNLDPDKPPSLPPATNSVANGKLTNLKSDGPRPVVTGNWGCGKQGGEPQLKAMIQWLAASQSDAPCLVYYTCGRPQVVKLDIVCRLILDRHWTVGDLAQAVLRYCQAHLHSTSLLGLVDLAACDSSTGIGLFPSNQAHNAARDRSGDQKCLFDELMGSERAYQFMETEL